MCARMLLIVLVIFVIFIGSTIIAESLDCPIKSGLVRCSKKCTPERLQRDRKCTKGRVCCLKRKPRTFEIPKFEGDKNGTDVVNKSSTQKPPFVKEKQPKKQHGRDDKCTTHTTDSSPPFEIIYPFSPPTTEDTSSNRPDDVTHQGSGERNYINRNTSKNFTNIHDNPNKTTRRSKWFQTTRVPVTSTKSPVNVENSSQLEEIDSSHSNFMNFTALNPFLYYTSNWIKAYKTSYNEKQKLFDCRDAEDRLRCRKYCPSRRRVPDRTCPFNRICCRGKPSSIYSPLRQAPFYFNSQNGSNSLNSEDQVFNYLINKNNVTDPIKIVNIDETNDILIQSPRPSKPISPNNFEDNNIIPNTKVRRSVEYCKRYQELTIEYLHAMPLLPENQPFTLPMDNCLPRFIPLIVGGKNVTKGEYPHMAAVGYHKNDYIEYLCGGTLISEKFVLTAAHCAETKWGPPVTVMLGSVELYAEDGVEIGVKRTLAHPDYKPPSYYHDIALIELSKDATFSQFLRPACLALPGTEAHEPGSVAIATGWGKTGFARPSTMHLMKVPLKIMQKKTCEEYYASDIRQPTLQDGINDKLICATGHESKYHDTCQGDSGGPLQAFLPGHNCMLEIVAVTSFGKTCGTAIPGVYTKIEPYIDWIENIVWP